MIYKNRCKLLTEIGLALEELNNYENFKDILTENQFKEVIRQKQNRKNKRYRTKIKILDLYKVKVNVLKKGQVVFGTITLDDKHLSQKENTYIRKIHKWLKEHFICSILNKDFGSKTEREHYHFIGLTTEDLKDTNKKSRIGNKLYKLEKENYNMGFEPALEIINLDINDFDKTNNYLLKLNNHSNKEGTKSRVRVIKSDLWEYLYPKSMKTAKNGKKTANKDILKNTIEREFEEIIEEVEIWED